MNDSTKQNKKYGLKFWELETGDIILESGKNLISKGIQVATLSQYSHTILAVDQNTLIDAIGEKDKDIVYYMNSKTFLFEKKTDIKVLRYKDGLSETQKKAINNNLYNYLGAKYSVNNALQDSPLLRPFMAEEEGKQFCSRLVAQIYRDVLDIKLVDNIDYCSPKDIHKSNLLKKVDNMTRKLSESYLENIEDYDPEYERKTLAKFIDKATKVCQEEVSNVAKILDCLTKNKTLDIQISESLKESGYLESINELIDNNKELLNEEGFFSKYGSNTPEIIISEITLIYKDTFMITNSINSYLSHKEKSNLITFKLLMNREYNYLSLELLRLNTMISVLKTLDPDDNENELSSELEKVKRTLIDEYGIKPYDLKLMVSNANTSN